ncbi:MAG: hypothetical protein JHC93_00140 [Parachlamydiales bacterium]|nr:hypothetical protein [Parachlamydiales bacterium]
MTQAVCPEGYRDVPEMNFKCEDTTYDLIKKIFERSCTAEFQIVRFGSFHQHILPCKLATLQLSLLDDPSGNSQVRHLHIMSMGRSDRFCKKQSVQDAIKKLNARIPQ